MKKLFKYPLLVLFAVFIVGFTILDCVTPTRTHSEFESNLSQMPKFSIKDLFNGNFTADYESYVNDQFLLRDEWITLKSYVETVFGKVENNGVIYGKDGYLFEKLTSYDENRLNLNIDAVQKFCEKYPELSVKFALIPNSYEVLSDKLPIASPVLDQTKLINDIYSQVTSAENVDILSALEAHNDEYIYYKTDHHWTTLGAYYAYEKLCDTFGLNKVSINSLNENTVQDFYGTYFSKAKSFTIKPDVIKYYDVNSSMAIMTSDQTGKFVPESSYDTLYDIEKFDTRDKYSAFTYSNNALTVITNNGEYEKERLLLIKDSYSNSLVPFLSTDYKEIVMVDLRYMFNISMVLEQYDFDDVLIMYNVSTFTGDVDVVKLKY